jgi:transcription elongation factor Elf1
MKLSLSTGIFCPKCGKESLIETTCWGGLIASALLKGMKERIDKEGCKLTCSYCKQVSQIKAKGV